MSDVKAVRFPVSYSLLESVLELPPGHFIIGVSEVYGRECMFTVEGPDFPEGVTACEPTITERRRSWDWGLS